MRLRVLLFTLAASLFTVAFASAWTGPTGTPPNNDATAPVNVGTTAQSKNGNLGVNGLVVFGNSLLGGSAGSNAYLNFGGTSGSGGYGFRDNGGTMQYANSGGGWTSFNSGASQWTASGSSIYYNGGNVGVGTASPAGPLDVESSATNTNLLTAHASGSGSNGLNVSGANFGIYDGGGTNYFAGNVGVGLTNPVAKLSVTGGSSGYPIGSANNGYYDIAAGTIAANTSVYSYGALCAGNSAGNCQGTGGTVIKSTGVQFPNGTLQTTAAGGLSGSGTTNYIPKFTGGATLGNSSLSDDGTEQTDYTRGVYQNSSSYGAYNIIGDATPWLGGGRGLVQYYGNYTYPGRNDATGWNTSWYLASNSSYGLYTNTGLYVTSELIDGGGGTAISAPNGNIAAGGQISGSSASITGQLSVSQSNGGSWGMVMTSGNYGLDYSGSDGCYAYLNDTSAWGFYTNCDIGAAAFLYASDERLKKNIEPLTGSLAKVLAMQPVSYVFKDPQEYGEGPQIGFIAQQVQQVEPLLVHTDASTTLESIDYAKVTPLLVGSVQELNAKIVAQQTQLDTQQQQINTLEQEVQVLENK